MAILYGDTYVDTNGVVLPSHTPTGSHAGVSWQRGPNTTGDLAIQANGVANANATFLDIHELLNQSGTWPADVSIAFDVHFFTNTNEFPAATARHAVANDVCYGAQWGGNGGGWGLVLSNAAGNFITTIASTAYTYPGNGVTDHMIFEVQGNALRLYKNGSLFVSGTDNTISAAGKPGVYGSSGVVITATTGVHIENFLVSDFSASGNAPAEDDAYLPMAGIQPGPRLLIY